MDRNYQAMCTRAALQSVADLCAELGTSVDQLFPLSSVGRSIANSSPEGSNATTGAPDVSLDGARTAQHEAVTRLLSAATAYSDSLAATTLDDDEVRAVQALPRGTLELLVLRCLDGVRRRAAFQSAADDPYVDALGVEMGASFRELVSAMSAKHNCAAMQATAASERARPLIEVRRNGQSLRVAPQSIERGDVLILSHGDVAPVDCIAVASANTRESFSIVCSALLGPGVSLARTPGIFTPCAHFGAGNVVPQSSVIAASSAAQRIVAVALTDSLTGSFVATLQCATETERLMPPAHTNFVETLPLFVAPRPTVIQRARTKLLAAAISDTIIVEREGVVESKNLSVTGALWWSDEYNASNSMALWNFSDTTKARADLSKTLLSSYNDGDVHDTSAALHSKGAAVADSVGAFHFTSFVMAGGTSTSRVAPVGPNEQLRRLLLGGMLATTYRDDDDREGEAPPFFPPLSHKAVAAFIGEGSWVAHVQPDYTPITKVTRARLGPGREVFARLFAYSNRLREDLCHSAPAHGLLVVWGDATAVAALSSHASSPKGIVPLTATSPASQRVSARQAEAREPSHLVGIALADVVLPSIGSRLEPKAVDVASLLSKSTAITYQGAFVTQPELNPGAAAGLQRLVTSSKSLAFTTQSRSRPEILSFVNRLGVVQDSAQVTLYDEGIIAVRPPPTPGSVVVYFNCRNVAEVVRDASRGNSKSVIFVGGTAAGVAGVRAAHCGVCAFVAEETPSEVSRALTTVADVVVKDARLDDFAACVDDALRHVAAHSSSS